jgi:hypothetical protein
MQCHVRAKWNFVKILCTQIVSGCTTTIYDRAPRLVELHLRESRGCLACYPGDQAHRPMRIDKPTLAKIFCRIRYPFCARRKGYPVCSSTCLFSDNEFARGFARSFRHHPNVPTSNRIGPLRCCTRPSFVCISLAGQSHRAQGSFLHLRMYR